MFLLDTEAKYRKDISNTECYIWKEKAAFKHNFGA